MIRNRHIFLWTGLIVAFLVSRAGAQWRLSLDTYTGQENNLLRYYNPVADAIFSPQVEIAYLGAQTRFYYNYNQTRILENDQYNYSVQQAGIDLMAGNEMKFGHYLGMNLNRRRNQPDYDYFDYWKAEGAYNFKYFPAGWVMLTGEIATFYKKFDEEPAWNHLETNLNFSGSIFLPTRTTLRVSLFGLLRDFSAYTTQDSVSTTAELSTLWQLVGVIRLAQSFGDKVGGYSDFLYRYNPSEGNPYQVEIAAFSPIDDYFGYKGYRWTNALKWKVSPQVWTKLAGAYYENFYLNRPVYEFDFESGTWTADANDNYIMLAENRRDRGYSIGLSAGLTIRKVFNRAANLEIIGSLDYLHNGSNDEYFVYADRSFGLQIRYDWQW
jgi:hypothetical protein